jgi:hypothetical protein
MTCDGPTPAQLKMMKDVQRRSKGWPVGIAVKRQIGQRLVDRKWAEFAPPVWLYRKAGICNKIDDCRRSCLGNLCTEDGWAGTD